MKMTKITTMPPVAKGEDEWRDQRGDRLQGPGIRLAHHHRNGLVGGLAGQCRRQRPRTRPVDLAAEVLQDVGRAIERAAAGDPAQAVDLVPQGRLVAWELDRKLVDLRNDQAAEGEDACERDDDDAEDGNGARDAKMLKEADDRRQHEAHQDRERDRDEHLAAKIHGRDNDDADEDGRYRSPRLEGGGRFCRGQRGDRFHVKVRLPDGGGSRAAAVNPAPAVICRAACP
jgi:hypothetical protein